MSWNSIKGAGAAGLLACGLLIVTAVVYAVAPIEGALDTVPEYLVTIIVPFAYLALIVAILGVHAVHRGNRRYRRIGMIGAVTSAVGYAIVTVIAAISLLAEVSGLLAVRIAAAGLVLIGSALLGVAVLIARVMPWWCGVLLIVAFPLGDVANEVFPAAENLLLALMCGAIGSALLTARGAAPARLLPRAQAVR